MMDDLLDVNQKSKESTENTQDPYNSATPNADSEVKVATNINDEEALKWTMFSGDVSD